GRHSKKFYLLCFISPELRPPCSLRSPNFPLAAALIVPFFRDGIPLIRPPSRSLRGSLFRPSSFRWIVASNTGPYGQGCNQTSKKESTPELPPPSTISWKSCQKRSS